MNPNDNGFSLYGGKWDEEEINNNLDIMIKHTLENKKSNTLIIDELGDFMDGWGAETVRKGHHLPQNMDNEKAFDVGLGFKLKLIDSLQYVINSNVRARIFYSPTFNHIIYVFLSSKFNSQKERIKELEIRCMVAAFLYNKSAIVIGIAWEKRDNYDVYDLAYHNFKEMWSEKLDKNSMIAINQLGYFKKKYEIVNSCK